jgi:FkbM family methyltransferase
VSVSFAILNRTRDALADGAARIVVGVPALEPAFVRAGRALRRLPWIGTFFRRGSETLSGVLSAAGPVFRPLTVGGVRLIYDVSEFTVAGQYFAARPWEPRTTEWMAAHLGRGATFVDVGAHHGYYALLAAALVGPGGRVHAIEPSPAALASLRRHLAVNACEPRVAVHALALSDEERHGVPFYLFALEANTGVSSLIPTWSSPAHPDHVVAVTTMTFDGWAAASRVGRIDGVKIDVEGAEERVIEGMRGTLAGAPPSWIVCETRWSGPLRERLAVFGYEASLLERIDGDFCNVLFTHRGALGAGR